VDIRGNVMLELGRRRWVGSDMATTIEPTAEAATGVRSYSLPLAEYERMLEAGIFDHLFRLELIRGELIEHIPPGQEHESCVATLHLLMSEIVARRAVIWPHGNSVGLPDSNSRPQPDITLLRWRDDRYRGKRPGPEDVILVIEVSLSALAYDRKVKVALYAEAGIPEYWLVNLVDKAIEVYKDPREGTYQSVARVQSGETIQLPGELDGAISVAEIIG
jgi:Uma2 family endonuclease